MEYGVCKKCRGKMYKTVGSDWRHIFTHLDNTHKGDLDPKSHGS